MWPDVVCLSRTLRAGRGTVWKSRIFCFAEQNSLSGLPLLPHYRRSETLCRRGGFIYLTRIFPTMPAA